LPELQPCIEVDHVPSPIFYTAFVEMMDWIVCHLWSALVFSTVGYIIRQVKLKVKWEESVNANLRITLMTLTTTTSSSVVAVAVVAAAVLINSPNFSKIDQTG
jgi:hypothetical protein